MFSFKTFIFVVFVALDFNVSFAEAQDGMRYVCLLSDPQNQCSSYCVSALQPVIDHLRTDKQESNICELKLNETEAKLNQVMEQLNATLIQIESQFKSLRENVTKIIPKVLDQKLDHILGNLSDTKFAILINRRETDGQLLDIQNSQMKIDRRIALQNFPIRIGSSLFYIEHNYLVGWSTAESFCREIGGHLAAFANVEEYNAISAKLKNANYWIGINDLDEEGMFTPVASKEKVRYMKWRSNEPKNDNNQHCAYIYEGEMILEQCNRNAMHYICQSDDYI